MYTKIVQQIHNEFNNSCEKFRTMNTELPQGLGFRIQNMIAQYQKKYPLHKIVTKNSVLAICVKYNLVFAPAEDYAGFIPEKNINDLKNFNPENIFYYVDSDDDYYLEFMNLEDAQRIKKTRTTFFGFKKECKAPISQLRLKGRFYICGPRKDFILKNKSTDGIDFTEAPDPIVLFSPDPDSKDVMVIVTAWGEEAGDENIVNHKMN